MGGLPCFLRPAELAPDREHHRGEAGGAADHVGDGLCHEDAIRAEAEQVRQQVRQRYHDDHLPEQGEEDGLALLVERLEGRLSAVLEALSDEREEVEVQRRDGVRQNGLVGSNSLRLRSVMPIEVVLP